MRRSTVLWFLIATCLGVALFLVKHEVQQREEQLASLHRQILASQEAIHVLEAEWSYLNRPDRLEALVRRHLNLVPLDTRRLGSVEMLPMRLPLPGPGDDPALPVDAIAPTLAGLPPLPVGRPVTFTREVRR
ncbi:MAG: hypothetical protein RLO51_23060 [Thalassobaculum sp.]|uniref:cell division protein FtsL n=1 Tax=Thalassobaculum sp. TaxID=2022740 RepID=UPI0032EEF84E